MPYTLQDGWRSMESIIQEPPFTRAVVEDPAGSGFYAVCFEQSATPGEWPATYAGPFATAAEADAAQATLDAPEPAPPDTTPPPDPTEDEQ